MPRLAPRARGPPAAAALALVALLALAGAGGARGAARQAPAGPKPPVAAKRPHTTTTKGKVLVDDYYW